jgi:hypothetical protein
MSGGSGLGLSGGIELNVAISIAQDSGSPEKYQTFRKIATVSGRLCFSVHRGI